MEVSKTKLSDFVSRRNDALFSLDYNKIVDFYQEYGLKTPKDPLVFWLVVFKAICNIKGPDENVLQIAQDWLRMNGFSEEIKVHTNRIAS